MFWSKSDAVTSFYLGLPSSLTVVCNIDNPNIVVTLINKELETMPLNQLIRL